MTERYGEYELLASFARGGMAEVFLGRRLGVEGFAREVVVKRMLPKLAVDEACVRMFLDEARLTAGLQHPNIAQVLDLGRVADTYFIAMELVDGPDLKSLFKRSITADIPIPPELAAFIVARVADGLQYAHDKTDPATDEPLNIVHRDVNHANILLSRHGGVKLVDFGVAHAENRSVVTDVGGLKGKMGYIAPEQCLGDPFDHRADIFALGVVLHELLTKKPLFYRKSDLETLENIVYTQAQPPSAMVSGLDDEIDAICLSLLEKKPDARPQDAAEAAASLDAWVRKRTQGNIRSELAAFIRAHAMDLVPTRRVPKRSRTSRTGIERLTTGQHRAIAGEAFMAGTSTRRRLDAAGPTTSRDNPMLQRRRAAQVRSNLPAARGQFVGHDANLAKIAGLFAANARLITLFGTAGVGKTRLALEHAMRHLKAFPESTAWWCDCSEVVTSEGAVATLAAALGVPLVGVATLEAAIEQVGHALKGRGRCLVVMNDFDRLVDCVDTTVAAWLALAPQARFLVTSRSLLRTPDEAAVEVQPLELPKSDGDAGESEAETFFYMRARAVRPDFDPKAADRAAVAAIVRRLDGVPLAIELAAARISVLGPTALLERLAKRFVVLRGRARGEGNKANALSSAIEWSWASLNKAERLALIQATVFAGGFTLDAAEHVLQVDGDRSVLDVVQALRDRSMLRVSGTNQIRFSLFESIREFAVTKVMDPKTLETTEARHKAHFLALSEDLSAKLCTHDGASARTQLAGELDNLVVAHERALAARPRRAEDVELALRIGIATFPLLIERGPVSLVWRLLGEALEAASQIPVSKQWMGLALASYGEVLARTGQPADGMKMAKEALRLGQRGRLQAVQANALIIIALCHWLTDQHANAMTAGIAARKIGQQLADLQIETRTLNMIGCVHFAGGDRNNAAQILRACVVTARQVGHQHMEAMAQSNVGCIHADMAELDEAERCFRSALAACERLNNRRGVGVNRCELAIVAQERGDFEAARRHFDKSMTALRDVGDRHRMAYARLYRGCFELERGEHRHAASLLRTAATFFESAGQDSLWAHSAAVLGYLHATAGSHSDAEVLFEKAAGVANAQRDPALKVVVEAMRGAAEAVAAIRHKGDQRQARLQLAADALRRVQTPVAAERDLTTPALPPTKWSKEARFAVRILHRLLPAV